MLKIRQDVHVFLLTEKFHGLLEKLNMVIRDEKKDLWLNRLKTRK